MLTLRRTRWMTLLGRFLSLCSCSNLLRLECTTLVVSLCVFAGRCVVVVRPESVEVCLSCRRVCV